MRALTTDERAQNVVLGSILVFGIAIAGLGIYQNFIVPDQNAEVESNHAQEIDKDYDELYAGLMNAAEQNGGYTGSIKLGTKYPPRALTLNPPPMAGTIRTVELGEISGQIDDVTGQSDPINIEQEVCGLDNGGGDPLTKALVYDPAYNEINGVGVHGYEHSAKYQDVNKKVVGTSQQLVEGHTINLRPLTVGSLSRTSSSSTTLTFKAGQTGGTTITTSSDWTLELPTRLDEDQQWKTILSEQLEANGGPIKSVSVSGDVVEITFEDGQYRLRCTPIGVDEAPSNEPPLEPDNNGDSNDIINPVGEGALEYIKTSGDSLIFNSNGDSHIVKEARIATVSSPGSNGKQATLSRNGNSVTVTVGGEFKSIDPNNWEWNEGEQAGVTFTSNINTNNPNNQIVLQLKLQDGSVNTYIVEFPTGNSGGGGNGNNGQGGGGNGNNGEGGD